MFKFVFPAFLLVTSLQALVLEDFIENDTLQQTLSHKKVGYYIGSFDPLHLGHQDTAQISLQKGLVDYVLIFPNWGGDKYKNRALIEERLKMIFAVFKDHPQVIVTRLSPQDMQKQLTLPDVHQTIAEKPTVKIAYKGTKFIGIIGSDTALKLSVPHKDTEKEKERQKELGVFMRGIQISDKYAHNTVGSIIALPAEAFIVALREGEELPPLKGKVADRPIIATIRSVKNTHVSSTLVKNTLKEHKPIDQMVDPAVLKIIQEDHLYQ